MTQAFPAERLVGVSICCIGRAQGRPTWRLPQCSIPRNMDGFRLVLVNIMTRDGPAAACARATFEVSMEKPAATSGFAYPPPAQGLYDPANERDACGLGFIAHIKGRKTHEIIAQGLKILENLTHRGATGADPLQGDGAGILVQLPDAFFRRACGKLSIKLPEPGHYA